MILMFLRKIPSYGLNMKKPLRIKTGDIKLNEGGIIPYINPKTKKPFKEYPNCK